MFGCLNILMFGCLESLFYSKFLSESMIRNSAKLSGAGGVGRSALDRPELLHIIKGLRPWLVLSSHHLACR